MLEDVTRGEIAEQQITAFIERRALKMNPEQRRVEEDWMESTRAHNARLRTERLWQRLHFHQAQLEAHTRTFEALLRRHRVGLRAVEEALGIAAKEGDAA